MAYQTAQGQYGGQTAPAVTSGGGAALASNLGSAALGMLTGGGSAVIGEAMKAAGDSSTTTQTTDATIGPQSTGSKVFNLQQTADAFANNDFWARVTNTGQGKSNTLLYIILGIIALGGVFFLARRR